MKYAVNQGVRDYAVRMGCERGIYLFVNDYAKEMGMSMSAAVRRLLLIGARCEAEHGNATMPATYRDLSTGPKDLEQELFGEQAYTKPTKVKEWL